MIESLEGDRLMHWVAPSANKDMTTHWSVALHDSQPRARGLATEKGETNL